ncbi:MAG: hypothetical protein ACKO96_22975, partial [Flammeovirgaceae bacterium]
QLNIFLSISLLGVLKYGHGTVSPKIIDYLDIVINVRPAFFRLAPPFEDGFPTSFYSRKPIIQDSVLLVCLLLFLLGQQRNTNQL